MPRARTAVLEFDHGASRLPDGGALRDGLSSAAASGDSLWVVNDATLSVERLSRQPGAGVRYAAHRQYALRDYLDLAAPAAGDIEGVDVRDGWLWITGSHSLRRSAAQGTTPSKALEQLARTEHDGNQFLVARVPLALEDGLPTLTAAVGKGRERRVAARLPGNDTSNLVTEALAEDEHLWPFVAIPGQENGLDIEGIAAGDEGRVFLGLRGPVLRGWAVVIELAVGAAPRTPDALALRRIPGAQHGVYRKHFLALDGLGIRDLRVHGRDLLLLAGPTMDLDGPFRLYRWRGGAVPRAESLVAGKDLVRLFDLPSGAGGDHPEGIALLPGARGRATEALVVYERAARPRLRGASGVTGDVFDLPR
jgi:hypothetical protein